MYSPCAADTKERPLSMHLISHRKHGVTIIEEK